MVDITMLILLEKTDQRQTTYTSTQRSFVFVYVKYGLYVIT